MVKLAYTQDLGSCAAMRAGSTPVTRTKIKSESEDLLFIYIRILLCIKHTDNFISESAGEGFTKGA